jgi:hypothetical protein
VISGSESDSMPMSLVGLEMSNKRTFHYNAKQPVEMDNEKGWYFPNQENRKKT